MSGFENERDKRNQRSVGGTIVHLHLGKPVTDSLTIGGEFLRPPKNVLQSLDDLIADGTINPQDFKPVNYSDGKGEQRCMVKLTEHGALIAIPFSCGRKSRPEQGRLVDAFMAMRADRAGQHIGNWSESWCKVSPGFQIMCDMLKEARADQGKATLPHHDVAEAKLIKRVLFGYFEAVVRRSIGHANLDLVDKIEVRDAFLIARGRTYGERNAELPAYPKSVRAKRERIAQ